MEHFQKVIYLLSLFLPVMVFFSLGLCFAWATWFKDCKNFDEAVEEHHALVETLNILYLKQSKVSEALAVRQNSDKLAKKVASFKSEIQKLNEQIDTMKSEHQNRALELDSLRIENTTLSRRLSKVDMVGHDDTSHAINIMEVILNEFADEPVSNDPELGILVHDCPDTVDDLTALNQLSSSVAAQLNKLGIYRYCQIALWTHEQFDNILENLSIESNQTLEMNGGWQKQAKELHQQIDQSS